MLFVLIVCCMFISCSIVCLCLLDFLRGGIPFSVGLGGVFVNQLALGCRVERHAETCYGAYSYPAQWELNLRPT